MNKLKEALIRLRILEEHLAMVMLWTAGEGNQAQEIINEIQREEDR